jgi:D-serine deaminase-like pyridoxal phosphate-dependent protein
MTLPPTPCLILDFDALQRNIARMAGFAEARGLRLRPHAKTHKSRAVAALQLKAGAVGICCATLHEAERLAGEVPSILLTSPVAGAQAIARVTALIERGVELAVVADHPAFVTALDAALPARARMSVLVDVDPGMGRTGVASAAAAVTLARAIVGHERLRYGGIQFYCGGEQQIPALEARRAAVATRNLRLAETITALTEAGLAAPVVTGGGTGTHGIDADAGLLTELQPGSYVFMDQDYGACELGGAGAFELALTVHATVVSANHTGWVTIDAGTKTFATDSGRPQLVAGAPAESVYSFTGDEFGRLDLPAEADPLAIGARIALATSHCDPTVNLHGAYHVLRDGKPAERWPVDARGYQFAG